MSLKLNAMPPPTMPPNRSMPAEMYGWLTASSDRPALYGSTSAGCGRQTRRRIVQDARDRPIRAATGGSDAACRRATVDVDRRAGKLLRRVDDVDVMAAVLVGADRQRSRVDRRRDRRAQRR